MEAMTTIRTNYANATPALYLTLQAELFIRCARRIGRCNEAKLQKINEISQHITDKAVGWAD